MDSIRSMTMGSEAPVSGANQAVKGEVLVTWVPTHLSGAELTVIAGDWVSILHSEPISLRDNPLAMRSEDGSDLNAVIILQSMHWTKARSRSGKVGVVPSNIVSFEGNPVRDCWTKVRIKHSYSAKTQRQLTVDAHEKVQIYGEVDHHGMILAKRKTGRAGTIPYSFIQIPAAIPSHSRVNTFPLGPFLFDAPNQVAPPPSDSYPKGRSLSATSESDEYLHHHRSSWDCGRAQIVDGVVQRASTKQLNFVIDGRGAIGGDGAASPPLQAHSTKDRLTSRLKMLSTTISTAIENVSVKAYSHGAAKTLPVADPNPIYPTASAPTPKGQENARRFSSKKIQPVPPYPALVPTVTDSATMTESETVINHLAVHRGSALTEGAIEYGDSGRTASRGGRGASTGSVATDDVTAGGAAFDRERHQTVSIATSSRTLPRGTSSTLDLDEKVVIPRSQQTLPFHWPFSSYPISKRSTRGKAVETVVLSLIAVIYLLPVMVEEPRPASAPQNYSLWFINLFLAFIPFVVLYALRMVELWTLKVSKADNPNTRMWCSWLFYVVLGVYFLGLASITVEVLIQSDWIHQHSPLLYLATMIEMLTFIASVCLLAAAILFILCWTFCCRITSNIWETRVDFYCCAKGEALVTKRYPKAQPT